MSLFCFRPSLSPDSNILSPTAPSKKRKLLDTSKNYLEEVSPKKPQLNVADIKDMIDDLDGDKLQVLPR